jgi:hypothetical protein
VRSLDFGLDIKNEVIIFTFPVPLDWKNTLAKEMLEKKARRKKVPAGLVLCSQY